MPGDESVLDYRVKALEESVSEIKSAVKSIDASLQMLAKLEVHHAETRDGLERAFHEIRRIEQKFCDEMEKHDTRIRDLELESTTTKLVKNWVIAGVTGGLAMIGTAMVLLVMK